MDDRLRDLAHDMSFLPGASDSAIAALQQAMQLEFPAEYLEFMRMTNGAEGFVGSHYLVLLPIEEILAHNEALETDKLAPGLVIFASNGAGTAYAFDIADANYAIVNVPYVGLSRDDALHVAPTFRSFLEALSKN